MYAASTEITTADFQSFLATCDDQLSRCLVYLFDYYVNRENHAEVAVMDKLVNLATTKRESIINQAAKLGYAFAR